MKISGSILICLLCATAAGCAPTTPKEAYEKDFLVGAALNEAIFSGENPREAALVAQQFNTISPENILKWEMVHPDPGVFDFSAADKYVEFGVKHKMFVVGHNLIWHSQTPNWVFQDAAGKRVDRDTLLARMREHIFTVVGRYKGRIGGWDVVNEALAEDGTLRQSPWMKIIGEDYLLKAYQFAHEADPHAELYYNDYALENPAKREGAIALIKKLQSQGVHIAAVGLQGHYRLDSPTASEVDETISAMSKLGLKVMITELDVDVLPHVNRFGEADVSLSFASRPELNPYTNGLPDSIQQQLSQRYADLFSVFVQHRDVITRVTFWGVTDSDSWLNGWPVQGRTAYPLLFDRAGKPKPAFLAVVNTAQKQRQ
jgi:endo-1,4-beta-xylanase